MPQGDYKVLVINPGSTSTKFALYVNESAELTRNIRHLDQELASFQGRPILDQLEFRSSLIEHEISEAGFSLAEIHAVAGRGGLLHPLASGIYGVNDAMLEELKEARRGEHASNLGAYLAHRIARQIGVEAYVVDPVSVDEWPDRARLSGMALLERRSLAHALNIKAVARRYASEHGASYEQLRLIVVHLGSGVSVTAHENGRMIEALDASEESPFSAERAGGVPARQLVRLCFSGKYTFKQMDDMLCRQGGIFSYLGTTDLLEVERRIAAGDAKASLVFEAMVYQNVKEIGAMAAVLRGRVDAILLTGGMARSKKLVGDIEHDVSWIAPVVVYPGEDELQALAEGVLRVLRCEELPREFHPEQIAMATEKYG